MTLPSHRSSFLRRAIFGNLSTTATHSVPKESQTLTNVVGTKPPTKEKILERTLYVFNPATTSWKGTEPRLISNNSAITEDTRERISAEITATGAESTKEVGARSDAATLLAFKLVTWNVDFSRPYQSKRLEAILAHIQNAIIDTSTPPQATSTSTSPPSTQSHLPILLLQEVYYTCFPTLLKIPLIRTSYAVSDISPLTWSFPESHYGTVTLIPLTLVPYTRRAFRMPLLSDMDRDALYVDVRLGTGDADGILRIANTHLESLRGDSDDIRRVQLESIATCLRAENVRAGVVGGDMNPIGPLDKGLPQRVGLLDAWIVHRSQKFASGPKDPDENGSSEKIDGFSTPLWRRKGQGAVDNNDASKTDSSTTPAWRRKGKEAVKDDKYADECDGYTWGVQPRNRFPKERMDKILYSGGLQLDFIDRIGIGLKISIKRPGTEKEERPWLSDHYGLVAHFKYR